MSMTIPFLKIRFTQTSPISIRFIISLQMSIRSTPHTIYPACPLHTPNIEQPRDSLPFSTIDQFPLTHKMKNPGAGTCPLTSPDSRNPLVFYTFSLFDSLTFVNSTTVSTCTVCRKCIVVQNIKLCRHSQALKNACFQGVQYISFCKRPLGDGGKVANGWHFHPPPTMPFCCLLFYHFTFPSTTHISHI